MWQTKLAESPEYTARRAELQQAEIELMRQRERVAQLRRSLPDGAVVEDYVFQENRAGLDAPDEPGTEVRLSELFASPDRALIVYHLMYGKKQADPCPMCTMWIDGFNATAAHLTRNAGLVVVAAAGLPALRAHARSRDWSDLRLLSCGDNTFKHDLGSEDADGNQDSRISVFTLEPDGDPRHFYTTRPQMSGDINQRGIDLLSPVWHMLDLTPQGRGDWYASLAYGPHVC
jgi:predicted dithiol-disulfide oxidoreductase (DUF899 family)